MKCFDCNRLVRCILACYIDVTSTCTIDTFVLSIVYQKCSTRWKYENLDICLINSNVRRAQILEWIWYERERERSVDGCQRTSMSIITMRNSLIVSLIVPGESEFDVSSVRSFPSTSKRAVYHLKFVHHAKYASGEEKLFPNEVRESHLCSCFLSRLIYPYISSEFQWKSPNSIRRRFGQLIVTSCYQSRSIWMYAFFFKMKRNEVLMSFVWFKCRYAWLFWSTRNNKYVHSSFEDWLLFFLFVAHFDLLESICLNNKNMEDTARWPLFDLCWRGSISTCFSLFHLCSNWLPHWAERKINLMHTLTIG